MLVFGAIFLVVALILIGVGIAIGVLIFGTAAAAIGFGMVSSSVACGIIQKKPSAGFRVFFYQFFVSIFLTAGIATAWLLSTFVGLELSIVSILLTGSISGISIGLIFALFHSYLVDLVSSHLKSLFQRSPKEPVRLLESPALRHQTTKK